MNTAQITIELAKMSGPDLAAAVTGLNMGVAQSKAQNIATLQSALVNGLIAMRDVQAWQGKGIPVGRATQAAPSITQTDPGVVAAVSATASAASRAESVALEAKALADATIANLAGLKVDVTKATEVIESLRGEVAAVNSAKGRKGAVDRAIAKEVAEAFAPIRAIAEANQTQEAVVAATAAPVGTATAKQVFGVDVRDVKGNPVMVELWGNPNAPSVDETFIWTEDTLAPLLTAQAIRANVWMGGEKGTGKTETARQFAARTGRAFTRINFHKFSTTEEYIGATALVNGNTEHAPGPMLLSHCSTPGAITLLDEVTLCDPGELATLHALLEPNGRVNIGGKVWTAAVGALCFVADNSGGNGDVTGRHAGVRVMNSALLDRFALKVPFTFLPLVKEIEAVVKHTGCNPALARLVMKVVATARNKVQTGEVIDAPSIRQVMAWVRSMPILGVRRAWQVSVASAQPAESSAAIDAIYMAEVNEAEMIKHL